MISKTNESAKYIVIFKNKLSGQDELAYSQMAERMEHLVKQMPGFVKLEFFQNETKRVTLSYWTDLEAIRQWKANPEHQLAQAKGKSTWYDSFELEVCEIKKINNYKRG